MSVEQLRDIHLPEAVSMWPPALGWQILFALLCVLLAYALWRMLCVLPHWRTKYIALRSLKRLRQAYQQKMDPSHVVQELSILMHRVGLYYFPRQQVAGLAGDAWLEFLDKHTDKPIFVSQCQLLITAPYQAEVNADLSPLFVACERWIKVRKR